MGAFATQILSCMAVVTTAAVLGFIAHTQRRSPRLVRLSHFVAGGVSFGFIIGAVANIYSDDFRGWILRQQFVPFRVQELFMTHEIDAAYSYAPAFGMIVGFGVAVLLVYLRHDNAA